MKAFFFALLWTLAGWSTSVAEQPTWTEINGTVYGAKPDGQGPIGGGSGYAHVVANGDFTVTNIDALIEALGKAKPGEVVFIPDETELDLTARIHIENLALKIPAGVTLAGNRGQNGSRGAILLSTALKTHGILHSAGPNVRIAGLRIQGPNPNQCLDHHQRAFGPGGDGHAYYYKLPVSDGIISEHPGLEVDNCEISAFSHAGVFLRKGDGHRIHHNDIHHCQYNGLGYGVSHCKASSVVEFNLFDWNRHSIAGSGEPGCGYIARHNVQLDASLSHCFDMHGGRDREDGTDIAGTTIEISNNTFLSPKLAVKIRGVPQDKCEVHHNWFEKHKEAAKAVGGLSEKTKAFDNVYGEKPTAAK